MIVIVVGPVSVPLGVEHTLTSPLAQVRVCHVFPTLSQSPPSHATLYPLVPTGSESLSMLLNDMKKEGGRGRRAP